MDKFKRSLRERLDRLLERGKSILLLGPRQTGKTTLVDTYSAHLKINLLFSKTRREYESDPDRLVREVEALHRNGDMPLIIIDEVQKVPTLMDAAQYLIDQKQGQFILIGSSARQLKHGSSVNLLPGRLMPLRLDPLTVAEIGEPLPEIEDLLIYGSLPSIRREKDEHVREEELEAYVELYLEDEVRSEALVRKIGAFENFLRLAATEAGKIVNFDKISQDIGVASTTVRSYYQVLEDCLIAERIEPFTNHFTRKKLVKPPRYLFFDLGLRRLCAQEPSRFPLSYLGSFFEQFIGLELLRYIRLYHRSMTLHFWRDAGGREVDWLLKQHDALLPIEVKWTDSPTTKDARHLRTFLKEYPQAKKGYVVCQTPHPQMLDENIEAISWKSLYKTLFSEPFFDINN